MQHSEALNIRLRPHQVEQFRQAAKLTHKYVAEFIRDAAVAEAARVVGDGRGEPEGRR